MAENLQANWVKNSSEVGNLLIEIVIFAVEM